MFGRAAAVMAVMLMLTLWTSAAALAVDSGYPTPIPSFSESEPPDDESEPPPTVPPGPPTTPPGPPPGPPPDDPPSLAATGFAVTTGMAAAAGLVVGGTALVRFARRRRDDE